MAGIPKYRTCTSCKKRKLLLEAFAPHRRGTHGYRPVCRICTNRYAREHVKKHPSFRAKRLVNGRKCMLMRKFGITPEEYQRMWDAQQGLCGMCGEPETMPAGPKKGATGVRLLAVDHDHKTGKVRELLCFRCNTVFGAFEEKPALFTHMPRYAERHKVI